MKLAFSQVKSEFIDYLKQQGVLKHYDQGRDVSIFQYADKFQQYIAEKQQSDPDYAELDDFSAMLSELSGMSVKDGKLFDSEEGKSLKLEDEKGGFIVDMFNDMLDDDDFQSFLDGDEDGSIDSDELEAYLKAIEELDGQKDEISFEDMTQGMIEAQEGKLKIDRPKTETKKEETETEEPETTSSDKASGAGSSGGASGASGGGGASGASGASDTTGASNGSSSGGLSAKQADTNEYMQYSLDELYDKQSEAADNVAQAGKDIQDVYSEDNKAVADKKDACDQAQKDYQEALENMTPIYESEEDEQSLQEQLSECLNNISAKQGEIDTATQSFGQHMEEYANYSTAVAQDYQAIAALDSEADDYEAQLAALQAKLEEDQRAQQEAYDAMQKDQQEINTKTGELEALQGEQETLEGKIQEACEKSEELQQEYDENVKEKQEAYDDASEALSTTKDQQLEIAVQNLATDLTSLNKINEAISKKASSTGTKNGKEMLEKFKECGGNAWNNFEKLCDVLGMGEEETMEYITNLCNSEDWGNGCIDPVLLCAQIMAESGYNPTIVGDGGLALGLGQFHTCAVDEVNQQYGTSYTYDDRSNPQKALEMMVLLLRYDYKSTGSTDGMLAMYNQGNPGGINTSAGQNYVNGVKAQLGYLPS